MKPWPWVLGIGGTAACSATVLAFERAAAESSFPYAYHTAAGVAAGISFAAMIWGPAMSLLRSIREDARLTKEVLEAQRDVKRKVEQNVTVMSSVESLRLELANSVGQNRVFFDELRRDFDGLGDAIRSVKSDVSDLKRHQLATDERLERLERDDEGEVAT